MSEPQDKEPSESYSLNDNEDAKETAPLKPNREAKIAAAKSRRLLLDKKYATSHHVFVSRKQLMPTYEPIDGVTEVADTEDTAPPFHNHEWVFRFLFVSESDKPIKQENRISCHANVT